MVTLQFDQKLSEFAPIEYLDGYLPIEDHGVIGDCSTAALVGRDGAISWLCAPRFDSEPVFCSILDKDQGGAFTIDVGRILGARHRYLGDTPILITELRLEEGILRITDLMPMRAGADRLRGGDDRRRHPECGWRGYRLRPPRYPDGHPARS